MIMQVWCHKSTQLKVRLLVRCFRSSVFCGREGLLSLTFCMHENLYNTLREMNRSKSTIGLLLMISELIPIFLSDRENIKILISIKLLCSHPKTWSEAPSVTRVPQCSCRCLLASGQSSGWRKHKTSHQNWVCTYRKHLPPLFLCHSWST